MFKAPGEACVAPWWGAVREGVQDRQTSSGADVAMTKPCFHYRQLGHRVKSQRTRRALGSLPCHSSYFCPIRSGILSALPVMMQLRMALRYSGPSCAAHADRNVAGEPREHVPGTGSVMLSSRNEELHGRKRSLG